MRGWRWTETIRTILTTTTTRMIMITLEMMLETRITTTDRRMLGLARERLELRLVEETTRDTRVTWTSTSWLSLSPRVTARAREKVERRVTRAAPLLLRVFRLEPLLAVMRSSVMTRVPSPPTRTMTSPTLRRLTNRTSKTSSFPRINWREGAQCRPQPRLLRGPTRRPRPCSGQSEPGASLAGLEVVE